MSQEETAFLGQILPVTRHFQAEVGKSAMLPMRHRKHLPTWLKFVDFLRFLILFCQVAVTLTCTRCSYSRSRVEVYHNFSIDLPEGKGLETPLKLEKLFDKFFADEVCYS